MSDPTRRRRVSPGRILLALLLLLSACASAPVATPTPTPSPTPTARPTPTPSPTPSPTPTPVPTPTPIPLDAALFNRRVTVLIIGTDQTTARRAQTNALNTDAMLVASINAAHDEIGVVAMPRDTVDLPLGDGRTFSGKANAIRAAFGINGLRNALSATFAIPIDYYIEIDMEDFGRLVDAVGGVEVTLRERLWDPHIRLGLNAGTHLLNGRLAYKYVRSRYSTDGDYGRGWRQMQVLMALARKVADPATDIDVLALASSLGSLRTDLPLDKLPTLLEMMRRAGSADVKTQVLQPPYYALFEGIAGARGWVMIPNIAHMRETVHQLMTD